MRLAWCVPLRGIAAPDLDAGGITLCGSWHGHQERCRNSWRHSLSVPTIDWYGDLEPIDRAGEDMATHDAGREVRVATFADALRRHRRAAGLTQEELAERAVMSPRGVRYLERGLRLPYPDTVRRLVAALELEPEEAQGLRSAASLKRRTLTGRSAASVLPVPYG